MRCKYIRKIFQNEENGYTVALFSTLDHEVPLSARDKFWADKKIIAFTAKGYDLPLTDEIEIEMEGEWETNSHGTQYKVETFLEVVPRTREGILGYLSCGSLKGIGPKTAERIVNRFGLDTLEVMEKYPQELLKIQGISQKKLDRIVDSFGKNKVFRELMTFLSPFHVTPKKANMILQKFRDQSVEIIRKQPYILCSVKGFGFLTVDAIARQCCAATNDPMRISGCVSYVLREAMKQNGHLYLEQEILVKDALKVLNKELNLQPVTETEILKVLYRLVMQDSIVVEENRVYITQQHQEEEDTASMIARKLHERIPVLTIEKELEEAQEDLNITLSEQQKEAVRMVFANPISIITGGPGTGKTTVLKIILYIYQKKCGNEVKLMAPTGRAARRMAESTGSGDATTMHMALGLFGDGDYEALIDELSADFINVDEVSMVDMHLAYEFFYKVKAGARVLLVGDVHQLPSVGAGDVFRQLILCGKIPVTVLNLVYRQGKDSNIPINAQLINEGKTNLQWGDDFQMVECSGADAAAQIVKNIYLKEIQMYGMEQVQILSPYKVRSAAGVLELNRSLQDEVNPPVSGKRELHLGGEIFREGDRILQNKNTEFASNGDLGTLVQIAEDEDNNPLVQIVFTDGRRVKYEAEQVEMIEHANAITIHKSQHKDIEDDGQTVLITERIIKIHTTATDKDGNKELEAGKEVTIIDTVTLEGLEVGTQYKLVGWQMLKEENAELLIDGKRVESDYTFTADSETMKVEVAFTFDATSLDGKQLVTFEELYDLSNPDEPKKVTEHKDIEDEGQTITFKEKPEVPEEPEKPETPPTPEKPHRPSDSPKTGDNTNLYGLLALLLTSGAGLAGIFFYKRRKMKKS